MRHDPAPETFPLPAQQSGADHPWWSRRAAQKDFVESVTDADSVAVGSTMNGSSVVTQAAQF
tara:strand:- start:567 stop:752 length:186 start_codon:yes stop_codon:yes gene_type:complete